MFGAPRTALWLNRLEIEHDNLRGALHWLVQRSNVPEALELAAGLRRFWLARSHHGEGQAWFTELLSRPGSEAPTLARAKALNGAGLVVWRHRKLTAARDLHLEARELLRTLDDIAEEAWTLWRCDTASPGEATYTVSATSLRRPEWVLTRMSAQVWAGNTG